MNYKEIIREAIRCPQFGDEYYGEWGALRYKQRLLIKRLLDECDSADSHIRKLYLEKQELIDYLKVSIKKTNDISEELDDIFYMGKLVAYKEILSKIEKE